MHKQAADGPQGYGWGHATHDTLCTCLTAHILARHDLCKQAVNACISDHASCTTFLLCELQTNAAKAQSVVQLSMHCLKFTVWDGVNMVVGTCDLAESMRGPSGSGHWIEHPGPIQRRSSFTSHTCILLGFCLAAVQLALHDSLGNAAETSIIRISCRPF